MKRDIIDSLMAGGLLSFLPIWEANTAEQIVIALGLTVLVYITILFFAKEKTMKKNDQEKDEILWIIRFSDGTLASFLGTKKDAEKAADKRATELGTSYIIV